MKYVEGTKQSAKVLTKAGVRVLTINIFPTSGATRNMGVLNFR